MPTNMQLTIIRHGESANNQLAISSATYDDFLAARSPDPLLTARGERQAEIVASHVAGPNHPENGEVKQNMTELPGYGITELYTSAMHRAMKTTQPIADALDLRAQVWVDIHEHGGMFHGNWRQGEVTSYPGMTRTQITTAFPDYLLPDEISDEGWWSGGYEDNPACEVRATRVADTLKQWSTEKIGEHIAIVTHGTFMDRLIKSLLDIPFDSSIYYFHYNTAITRINFMDNGYRIVRFANRVQHLAPGMVTK